MSITWQEDGAPNRKLKVLKSSDIGTKLMSSVVNVKRCTNVPLPLINASSAQCKCDICGKEIKPSSLKTHFLVHSGENHICVKSVAKVLNEAMMQKDTWHGILEIHAMYTRKCINVKFVERSLDRAET